MSRLLAAALLATALTTACGGGPACEAGDTQPCYSGPDVTRGVGLCRDGVRSCVDGQWAALCDGESLPRVERCDALDNDCDGTDDEEVRNACGGCATLEAQPGEACPDCGTWACEGEERVTCTPPAIRPGTACDAVNGCEGVYRCGDRNRMECAGELKNACSLCGGPAIEGLGGSCTGANGCSGRVVCNLTGTETACNAPQRNGCGACGVPTPDDLGVACTNAAGCPGTLECDGAGTGTVCRGPEKNECGTCGGPRVLGLGTPCTAENVCDGALVCNAAGTGTVCGGAPPNNCGVCGAADVPGLGTLCSDGACPGRLACAAGGTTSVCDEPIPNECGVCGGPALPLNDQACTGPGGCSGTLVCTGDGLALGCQAPVRNNCGVCGAPDVAGVGAACTPAEGCAGELRCNAAQTGTVCVATAHTNACEVCGGPAITDLNAACTTAAGCEGTRVCNAAGTATDCQPLDPECGRCATSGGTACDGTNGCRGVTACDAAGAPICETPENCSGTVVISEFAGSGPSLPGRTVPNQADDFIELHNPTIATIDLTGYRLWRRSSTGTSGWLLVGVVPDATMLPPGGFFLFTNTGYVGTVAGDAPFEPNHDLGSGGGGQLLLTDTPDSPPGGSNDATINAYAHKVDRVGYGTNAKKEGSSPAPATTGTGSIERKARVASTDVSMADAALDGPKGNGQDANDNGADFVVRAVRQPQNLASTPEP